jgi:hypothetical protein
MAKQFIKDGQEAWFHDQGHWGGFFHTYDRFLIDPVNEKPHKIHIFLPRDYEVSQNSYPVVYMNDGDQVFFPDNLRRKSWKMPEIITRLYLGNQISKIILVAVCPLNRDYEYTHAPVLDHEWGGLDHYAAYLARNIKGFIDKNYRTISDPSKNLVVGASHGGLAAFYTAIKHPDRFGCVAALSPSFWVGLDSAVETSWSKVAGSFLSSLESSALWFTTSQTLLNPQKHLKIYLDWGLVREGGDHNSFIEERATARGREMRDLLIKKFHYREHHDLFVVEDPLGEHTEESWSSRMENVLKIFFGL